MIQSHKNNIISAASTEKNNLFWQWLVRPASWKKYIFFLVSDVILIIFSLYLAFLFQLDFNFNINYFSVIEGVLPWFISVKLIAFFLLRIYKITWRYIGLFEMINIFLALFISGMVLIMLTLPAASFIPFNLSYFPKRVIAADMIISFFFISALRISKRLFLEVFFKKAVSGTSKRTLIIGAGNAGEMILRDMARRGFPEFKPIGFLDDDELKNGTYIHGVKVLGTTKQFFTIIAKQEIQAVIIAIPSLNHKKLRELYETATKQKIADIKVIPRLYNYSKPNFELISLEDISIEDLIGRQAVCIDAKLIECFLKDQSILITGAGGSIGSEIAMQVCAFQPRRIALFDVDETELHNLGLRLNRRFPKLAGNFFYATGDVRDAVRLEEVFQEHVPRIVFHAAAMKHVPMMEGNPKEAVKVNMFGTNTVARAARNHGVEKFIMISTDKAVRPTSIMGATKRMAEFICQALNDNGSHQTQFISVRFGNVLGSRGSVLPIFLDQIKHSEALTVTHQDMKRYFMTIPEAVSLVLQASATGIGGNVMVLDMGAPVNITAFAEDLIRLHGLKPYQDIDIKFTGLRPGEKLFEEILTAEEGTDASRHEKIFIARNNTKFSLGEIDSILKEFNDVLTDSSAASHAEIRQLLKKYVKHYESYQ